MQTPPADLMAAMLQGQQPMQGPPSPMQGAFGVPPPQLQRMAGDVVKMPGTPGPNAGPLPPGSGAVLNAYQSKAPNVSFMPPSTYEQYMQRRLGQYVPQK